MKDIIVKDLNLNSIPDIVVGMKATEFGNYFLAMDDKSKAVCCAEFLNSSDLDLFQAHIKQYWPNSRILIDNHFISNIVDIIFDTQNNEDVTVLLNGTEFQKSVWRALARVKIGTTASYQDVAHVIGKTNGVRAVANAIGNNRIAYLIPCHRIIAKTGELSGYRWGPYRKFKLLQYEKMI